MTQGNNAHANGRTKSFVETFTLRLAEVPRNDYSLA
jgi:hypothetical protein